MPIGPASNPAHNAAPSPASNPANPAAPASASNPAPAAACTSLILSQSVDLANQIIQRGFDIQALADLNTIALSFNVNPSLALAAANGLLSCSNKCSPDLQPIINAAKAYFVMTNNQVTGFQDDSKGTNFLQWLGQQKI